MKSQIDLSKIHDGLDFYHELVRALGAPYWHGLNINAVMESLIYGDNFPLLAGYEIEFVNCENAEPEIVEEARYFSALLKSEAVKPEFKVDFA